MTYTVAQLAAMAGISVRTLHYYDRIDLLKPSSVSENGYRRYGKKELLLLQQILYFRELGFPLSQIRAILAAPDFDVLTALKDHRKMLLTKQAQLEELLVTVSKTIRHMQNKTPIQDKELFGGVTSDKLEEYQREAKERWGNTKAYKQSAARTKHWKKDDYQRIAREGAALTRAIADLMDLGPRHENVQILIAEHHKGIEVFYECSMTMYRGLADMYVTDKRFEAYYESFKPGLAMFMQQAIHHFANTREER